MWPLRSRLGLTLPSLLLAVVGLSARPDTSPRSDPVELSYGSHPLQRLDIWRPEGPGPHPVLIDFHGGGFRGGDKRDVRPGLVAEAHDQGIALVSANYRLTPDARFPAPMLDGARAVQYLRANAARLNLDPSRIAVSGNSAGGGIALWIALHDDLARSDSPDPFDHPSTRVACAAVVGAQTSYDPDEIRRWIGGRAHEHPALPAFLGEQAGRPQTATRREASPIEHASLGDPPIWMTYSEPPRPLPDHARPGQGIHHPTFGYRLRDRLEHLGIACVVRLAADNPDDDASAERALVAFVRNRFDSIEPRGNQP